MNDTLLITSPLGEPAPGGYRERILQAALVANGRPHPRNGIIAYSIKQNTLYLFERIPEDAADPDAVARKIRLLEKEARMWREALAGGTVPVDFVPAGGGESGARPFGGLAP